MNHERGSEHGVRKRKRERERESRGVNCSTSNSQVSEEEHVSQE